MKTIRLLGIVFAMAFIIPFVSFAQDADKTVSLVVFGEATTKEEATKVALRSAIEQAFGTFVSANTEVLNDELVKDEIVTISRGNIQSYKELSYTDKGETKEVSLQAVVAISKLISYAQNKGMTTELAGATFMMNKKIRQLNKKNELAAFAHLSKQLEEIAESGLFSYRCNLGEPYSSNGLNAVDIILVATPNKNAVRFYDVLYSTLSNLALTKEEVAEYQKVNEPYSYLAIEDSIFYTRNPLSFRASVGPYSYKKRANVCKIPIEFYIVKSLFGFKISDNLGNCYQISQKEVNKDIITRIDFNVPGLGRDIDVLFDHLDHSFERTKYFYPIMSLAENKFSTIYYFSKENKYENGVINMTSLWDEGFLFDVSRVDEEQARRVGDVLANDEFKKYFLEKEQSFRSIKYRHPNLEGGKHIIDINKYKYNDKLKDNDRIKQTFLYLKRKFIGQNEYITQSLFGFKLKAYYSDESMTKLTNIGVEGVK